MTFVEVDDPDDERLAPFRRNERGLSNRPQRREDAGAGWFMAEGDLVVERALSAGCRPVAALVDGARPPSVAFRLAELVPVHAGGDRVRAAATRLGVPSPIVAIFERPPRPSVDDLASSSTHLVVAEAVDNPSNVGSIVRSAAALGWHGLVLDRTSADPLARRSLRVSMGHAVAFPHARTVDVADSLLRLHAAGFTSVALTPATSAPTIEDLPRPARVALVVGAERSGLSDAVLAATTWRARIRMAPEVDSLNVAAAVAIACHALGPPT